MPNSNSLPSLPQFVAVQKRAFLEGSIEDGKQFVLCIGNEAGDLDSAASSMALSYLFTYFSPSPQSTSSYVFVPLLQTDRADLKLRPENQLAFSLAGLDPETLLCRDDLFKLGDAPKRPTHFALVDHNRLNPKWQEWAESHGGGGQVKAIIDHHADEGVHVESAELVRKVMSPTEVGSCASLVTDYFRPVIEERIKEGKPTPPSALADLLLSAIAIDTGNLKPGGKARDVDRRAFAFLLPLSSFAQGKQQDSVHVVLSALPESLKGDANEVSAEDEGRSDALFERYFSALSRSKFEIKDMESRDLLRRDYKEIEVPVPDDSLREEEGKNGGKGGTSTPSSGRAPFHIRIGFSTVPLGLHLWLHRSLPATPSGGHLVRPDDLWAPFWASLDAWMSERNLDLAVVLNSFREPRKEKREGKMDTKLRRELVVCFRHRPEGKWGVGALDPDEFWRKVKQGLEEDETLDLQEWKGEKGEDPSQPWKKSAVGGLLSSSPENQSGERWEKRAMVWKQGNAKATRKQVLPIVRAVVEKAIRK